jgi:hypothetical protein
MSKKIELFTREREIEIFENINYHERFRFFSLYKIIMIKDLLKVL